MARYDRLLQLRSLAACLGLLLAAPATARAAEPEPAGFVLSVSGKWLLAGSPEKLLAPGDTLPAGGKIRPENAAAPGSIEVARYDGTAERHEAEFALSERVEAALSNRVLGAVLGKYRGRVIVTASRGTGLLTDGVVLLESGKVDVSPIFQELPAGKWRLRISPTRESAASAVALPPAAVDIDWNGEKAPPVAIESLKQGLYDVQLVSAKTSRPAGEVALILICEAPAFETKRQAYDEAVKLTAKWEEGDIAAGAETFRRIFLETLAE